MEGTSWTRGYKQDRFEGTYAVRKEGRCSRRLKCALCAQLNLYAAGLLSTSFTSAKPFGEERISTMAFDAYMFAKYDYGGI
jgi:hypothetical protein